MNSYDRSATVSVAYATVEQQFYVTVAFEQGMTVKQAIQQSGIPTQVELPAQFACGIFSQRIDDLEQLLQAGDRVEIYRSLTANPKEIRRKRAAANPTSSYCRGNRFKQLYK